MLKDLLSVRSCIGTFCKTTDSSFIEAVGHAGLDFVILDREHGPIDWTTIQNHSRAARSSDIVPIVRVKSFDAHEIGSALDNGAAGVQVPNVSTVEQAQAAVSAARFYPVGSRGVCRFVQAAEYGKKEKSAYFSEENQKLLIIQVEGLEGLKNIDAIVEVEGVDVLFIGPYDLSQSVGKPGEIMHPLVMDAIEKISMAAKKKNKALGIFCDTPEALTLFRGRGVAYIAYSVDISLFREAIAAIV